MKILIALTFGAIAGFIDVFAMRKITIPRFIKFYTFAQWLFIAFIIPFVEFNLHPVLTGILVAFLGMIPLIIIAFSRRRKTIKKIMLLAIVMGATIGFICDKMFY